MALWFTPRAPGCTICASVPCGIDNMMLKASRRYPTALNAKGSPFLKRLLVEGEANL